MIVDLRTMYIAMAATCLIVAASLFAIEAGRYRRDGMLQWALGWALQGVYWTLLGLRGVVWDFASIVIANVCLAASYSLLYAAVRKFQGRPSHRSLLLFPPVAMFLFVAYFSIFVDNVLYRTAFISVLSVLQVSLIAWVLFREAPRQEGRSQRLTGSAFLIAALLWIVRLIEGLNLPRGPMPGLPGTTFVGALLIAGFVVAILSTMGFVLMIRGRAERALHQSEQRLATTLSSIGDAVIAADVAGRITFMNPVAQSLTGWTLKDASQKPVTDVFTIINEHTRNAVEDPVAKVLKEGAVVGLANHTILVTKDGREVPIDDSGAPIKDASSKTTGVVLVFRDITERKETEERAGHLASFPELNPDPVIEVNASGEITFCNPGTYSVLEHLGMERTDCVGFVPSDLTAILDRWDREHESTLQREVSLGNRVFAETVHLVPQFGVARIYAHDVTEREEAEERLLRAKEEWERTFASVPDMVAIMDTEHRILRVNEAMARRLKASPEECVGLRCFEAIHGTSGPPSFCPHAKSLKDGLQHVEEVHEERLGGDFLVSTTPLHDQEGRMIGTVHVAHDITGRKAAEEALRESQRQMNRAQEIAHLGSWELDLVKNHLSWSDEVYRIFGLQPQEFGATYDAFLEAVHPDDRAAVDAAYSGSLREGRDIYEIEHRVIRRSNGEVRVVHEKCEHLRDDTGRIVKSVGMVHDITEGKAAENALRDSENRLRLFIEHAPAAVAMFDRDMRYVAVSRRWLVDYGLSDENIIGRCHYDVFPEMPERWKEVHRRCLAGATEKVAEDPFLRSDGKTDWVSWEVLPWYEHTGDIGGIIIFTEVVTARKQAEERLLESEELYRTIVETATEGIWIGDTAARTTFVNKSMAEMLGYAPEELAGRIAYDFMDEEARALATSNFERRQQGLKDSYEQKYIRKDGTTLWTLTSGAPLRDKDGRVVASLAILTDITDLKRSEEALKKAYDGLEQRVKERTAELRSLIEASLDPLVTISREGKISDVNVATELATGYSREELIGTDFADYFTEPEKARQGYERVFAEESVRDYPLDIRHRDGRVTPVLYNASVYRDDAGSVIGVFAAARDVSERQKLEAQLRQAQKMEALGTLSGGIAHDFNNILAAIIGFGELLVDHIGKGSREERHVKRILEGAMRGREVVKQLLAFSRKAEQEKKPLVLSSVVTETISLLKATTPATIAIRTRIAGDSGLILGDPTQIHQVLVNLCNNAVYAMRETGGTLDIDLSRVTISPSDGNQHGIGAGPYMKLTVRDTGSGMPPDIMDKIFDPFFTTKNVGEGTGLGLSVVHGILTQSNASIFVESEPDRGTAFTVYFPEISGEAEAEGVEDAAIPTGSEHILFVDDEEAIIEMGEDILAELGYEVTSRMNGREAITLLKENTSRFDLVLTDVTMPEMTGIDLTREVLAIRPDMPVIMCTGYSHLVDADKARSAGVRAFVMKPMTKREIAKIIRQVLDSGFSIGNP